jgi:hypothetical protein
MYYVCIMYGISTYIRQLVRLYPSNLNGTAQSYQPPLSPETSTDLGVFWWPEEGSFVLSHSGGPGTWAPCSSILLRAVTAS